MEENTDRKHKTHKAPRAGVKAKKKEIQRKKREGIPEQKHKNPRAFIQKIDPVQHRKALDLQEKKLHVKIPTRTYEEEPPKLVVITGPPKCGKTTLLRSLIKHYTKNKVQDLKGPITIRANKTRITFIECPNDLNAQLDLCKVADLVLLLIDASFGFEMETFEFLNMLQIHGFTRVMGILNHLDLIKNEKTVKRIKKQMKQRFWQEVCKGAKVFYLSGLRDDLYTSRDILNLSRFISVSKIRPLTWRTTHPGVLVDRFEEITNQEEIKKNPKCNRHVCLYGYVRGTFLKREMTVHIPGAGDFQMHSISSLDDPLPRLQKRRRTLDARSGDIYGPMSNLGGLFYDKDSVYLEVNPNLEKDEEQKELIDRLKNVEFNPIVDEKLNLIDGKEIKVERREATFSQNSMNENIEFDEEEDDEEEYFTPEHLKSSSNIQEETFNDIVNQVPEDEGIKISQNGQFEEEEKDELEHLDEMEDVGQNTQKWKDNTSFFYAKNTSIFDLVYETPNENLDDDDLSKMDFEELDDWDDENVRESIRNKFVTGDWSQRRSNRESSNQEEEENEEDEEQEEDDDIVDSEEYKKKKLEKKRQFLEEYEASKMDQLEDEPISIQQLLKQNEEVDPQLVLNKNEFKDLPQSDREKIEGFAPGKYVRIEIKDMPCEFLENLDFTKPIIVGGCRPEECQLGFIKIQIKKHRWFPKLLKNKDPLIFSIGWRRFQSIPVYCVRDVNGRYRMIKYTPEHMHCTAVIYGPATPQNTGFIAFQSLAASNHFRVAATGYTMEIDKKFSIVKKLKLQGIPTQIKKNTAIISGMFNSDLEVAKFEGASLKCVSGIRGQVKKAAKRLGKKPGDFRATFEDRILKSDIVFLRTWYPIELPKFYNPIFSHLTKNPIIMRTVRDIRILKGLKIPKKKDSEYVEIKQRNTEGHDLEFKPPKKLLKELPFKDQEKKIIEVDGLTTDLTGLAERAPLSQLTDAFFTEEEKKKKNFLAKLKAIDAHRKIQQQKMINRRKLKEERERVREERMAKKRKRLIQSRRYVQEQLKRAKKAKYVHEEQ